MFNIDVEKLVKENKQKMVNTTQLRLLLSNAVIVKNKISIENSKDGKLSESIQSEIKYLLIKHIYQCGREPKMKDFDETFKISFALKNIKNSVESFNNFYRYLEEIVAYVKYYIN